MGKRTRILLILMAFVVSVSFSFAAKQPKDEVYIQVFTNNSGQAWARTYSVKKQKQNVYYSLYIVKKEKGKWVQKTYVRSILMPRADKKRKGKYRYVSDYVEEIEWLKNGRIYQLIPHDKNYHKSKPFWKNPLK